MRVGIFQFIPTFKSIDTNLGLIESAMENISADLVVLPELATTGYAFESKFFGMAELDGDSIYNTCVLISKDQQIYKYRKVHLFKQEKLIFTPGNLGFIVADIEGVKIGLLICFDWLFPEATRTLALRGAQIICHPSNLILAFCQPCMRTRAIENRVFIITANRTGMERGIKFTGRSQIVIPNGALVLQFGLLERGIKIIEINPDAALNKQITDYNHIFSDRRPEFYQ
ncbi:MAG: beta-ureidopropionase [Candidatus Stahlbacteria bacterium]|nr:beta-ureidopropionase [Candidatus Stahlbacteria bacterium]